MEKVLRSLKSLKNLKTGLLLPKSIPELLQTDFG